MEVSGNRNAFDFVVAPTHFARDDFAIFADADGMPLRVSILDIDRGGEGMHGFPINLPQAFVKALVLFGLSFDLSEQMVAVDAHRDVTGERTERSQILVRKLFATGFFTKQDDAD